MLTKQLYVPASSVGSTIPDDVGRFFACVGQDMTDDTAPSQAGAWQLDLRKLERRIIEQGFVRKRRDKVIVVDIERGVPLTIDEYVSVIELIQRLLPGWTIVIYLIPTYPDRDNYFRTIMQRTGVTHVYMGVHRQHDEPGGLWNDVGVYLKWAVEKFTNGDPSKVMAGTIPWADAKFPDYRLAGSYLADISEICRMKMKTAMWIFGTPRTSIMDAYRKATLQVIRTCTSVEAMRAEALG